MTEQPEILNTGWKRIDDVIRYAQKRGLEIEVDNRSEGAMQSISLDIREKVDPDRNDMLAMNQRARYVMLHWCWIHGPGRTPRLAGARASGFGITSPQRDLAKEAKKHRHLSVYNVISIELDSMADEQTRHP